MLKPKVIGKNGYRYYSLKQLYLMDAIRFFLDTGMSMKEVKTYLDNRTTDLFLEATQAGIEKMKKQRDVLDARIGMIEKMRYITQRALLFPKDKPRLSFWDETWLITTDVKPERTQQAFAQAVSEHAEFCKSSAGVTKFPLGRIVHFPCSDHPEDFWRVVWRANRGAITRSFFIGAARARLRDPMPSCWTTSKKRVSISWGRCTSSI